MPLSESNIFAGTWDFGVYLSTNNGTSWTQTALNDQAAKSLVISGGNIFAGTYNGIYLSTNNGTSWTQTALNNITNSIAISGSNIFAGTNSGIFLSTNNGTSWINKNQGFNVVPIVNALVIANNYIFAGTVGNSVWRRSLSEIIGVQNISSEVPVSYSLGQNYPNPFNPVTKIKFSIVSSPHVLGGNLVQLKVYDVMGREVQTLVNESLKPGTYEVTFDGSTLKQRSVFL